MYQDPGISFQFIWPLGPPTRISRPYTHLHTLLILGSPLFGLWSEFTCEVLVRLKKLKVPPIYKAIYLSQTRKNQFLTHLPWIDFQTIVCNRLFDIFLIHIRVSRPYIFPTIFCPILTPPSRKWGSSEKVDKIKQTRKVFVFNSIRLETSQKLNLMTIGENFKDTPEHFIDG